MTVDTTITRLARRMDAYCSLHEAVVNRFRSELLPQVAVGAHRIIYMLANGGTIFLCGNGGSAAQASHLAGELIGRFSIDRRPLSAICLSADAGVTTCIGNDFGFDQIFERQIFGLAKPGDMVIGFTTSGKSPNVLRAFEAAAQIGVATFALTGSNGLRRPVADIEIRVPTSVTAHIQEIHLMIIHLWCEEIDRWLAADATPED